MTPARRGQGGTPGCARPAVLTLGSTFIFCTFGSTQCDSVNKGENRVELNNANWKKINSVVFHRKNSRGKNEAKHGSAHPAACARSPGVQRKVNTRPRHVQWWGPLLSRWGGQSNLGDPAGVL